MEQQRPTLQGVRIGSTRDALQVFYAVARQVLPMITRRLDAEERRAIIPGNVYVWEERCANSEATGMGMERWTDGMGWGPSRVRDEFLFYHQRESDDNDDTSHPSTKWANVVRRRESHHTNLPLSRTESERLVKQTYSVHVSLPEDYPRNIRRKWHLTAYFTQSTVDSLNTIDVIRGIGDAQVPEGWFKSARASKLRRTDGQLSDEAAIAPKGNWRAGRHLSDTGSNGYLMGGGANHVAQSDWIMASQSTFQLRSTSIPLDATQSIPRSHGNLPTLSDSGLKYYRDPSPFASSSSSSDRGASPLSFSPVVVRATTTPAPRHPAACDLNSRDLVPLVYLEQLSPHTRDPLDEDILRRLSRSTISRAQPPRLHGMVSQEHPSGGDTDSTHTTALRL